MKSEKGACTIWPSWISPEYHDINLLTNVRTNKKEPKDQAKEIIYHSRNNVVAKFSRNKLFTLH